MVFPSTEKGRLTTPEAAAIPVPARIVSRTTVAVSMRLPRAVYVLMRSIFCLFSQLRVNDWTPYNQASQSRFSLYFGNVVLGHW